MVRTVIFDSPFLLGFDQTQALMAEARDYEADSAKSGERFDNGAVKAIVE